MTKFDWRSQSGETTLEFVGVVLVLLLPLVYLVVTFFALQGGMYAAENAAAQVARILTSHPHGGMEAARISVELAAQDQGIPADNAEMRLDCVQGQCPASGASGEITVKLSVPLPVLGTLLEGLIPAEISVVSSHPIKWGEHSA